MCEMIGMLLQDCAIDLLRRKRISLCLQRHGMSESFAGAHADLPGGIPIFMPAWTHRIRA